MSDCQNSINVSGLDTSCNPGCPDRAGLARTLGRIDEIDFIFLFCMHDRKNHNPQNITFESVKKLCSYKIVPTKHLTRPGSFYGA
jgi:hypothetical protein